MYYNSTKSYSLVSGDDRFTIEGNITVDKNQYYISLEIKGINDKSFDNKIINNAEYSIVIDNKIIYNNGDASSISLLVDKQSLSKYISKISINHNDTKNKNLKSVLENGLILQIKYIDENNEINTINIPVLVKR